MRSSIASGLRRTSAAGLCAGVLAAGLAAPSPAAFAQSADRAPALAGQRAPGAPGVGSAPSDTLPATPFPAPASGDPRAAEAAYETARRLLDTGRLTEALAATDNALAASPSDARLRFLKGVILAQSGRETEAIDVFRALTQDFPELPEPYNNLAALHASRGDLDAARAALAEAIRALPSYALARENLGDVYLRLAMREWSQAAKLNPAGTADAKLRQALELSERIAPSSGSANPPADAGSR